MTLKELQQSARIASEKVIKKYATSATNADDNSVIPQVEDTTAMLKEIDELAENKAIISYINKQSSIADTELRALGLSDNTVRILLGKEIE